MRIQCITLDPFMTAKAISSKLDFIMKKPKVFIKRMAEQTM